MSIKHIQKYYEQVTDQYTQLREIVQRLQFECSNNLVEPERIEQFKKNIQPLMDNYEQISWIMYLLHQPNKKEKIKKYEKLNQDFLKTVNPKNCTDSKLKENEEILKRLE